MQFSELIKRVKEVRESFREQEGDHVWGATEHMQGFVGDVGDLTKLVMAKSGYRNFENLDDKLAHELADCLYSIVILADDLGIDLESAFVKTMDEVEKRNQTSK